ncbi:MAG: hypothetical protein CVU56_23345, partial [Deltaproteobacteria bacterium HGW-Deltaproteobacteria-14]
MAPDDLAPTRVRWLTALVIAGVFLAGGAAGFGLARWLAPAPDRMGPPPPPPLGRLLDDLGLEGDQRARAAALTDRFEGDIEAIMRETFPRIRALREQAGRELRALLTPEQAARFDALEAKRAADRPPPPPHHRRGDDGGGHPRGPD